ncbi:DUF4136 domain-containing protein [Shewanella sp. A25]|nr:DUF4136 domain-containing protein [Shewanella shenzhenensis]
MGLTRFSILLTTVGLLSACSTTPKNDYDLNYDFSSLKSFDLRLPQSVDDPLSAERIQNEIKQQLLQKGFNESASSPDFHATFNLQTQDKPQNSGLSIGLGTGSIGHGGGIGIGTSVGVPLGSKTAKIQMIQIDIIDVQTNRLIWRGSDSFDFDSGGENKAQDTQKAVGNILAQFPPKR